MRSLERDGWYVARKMSHVIMRHPDRPASIPVPNHPTKVVVAETLRSILNQAGLTPERFRQLL